MNFRVAFTVESVTTGKPVNDPKFAKWYARIKAKDSKGVGYEEMLDFHECSAEELDKFSPVKSYDRKTL